MVCACFGVRNGIGAKAALVSIEQSIMQRGSGRSANAYVMSFKAIRGEGEVDIMIVEGRSK